MDRKMMLIKTANTSNPQGSQVWIIIEYHGASRWRPSLHATMTCRSILLRARAKSRYWQDTFRIVRVFRCPQHSTEYERTDDMVEAM